MAFNVEDLEEGDFFYDIYAGQPHINYVRELHPDCKRFLGIYIEADIMEAHKTPGWTRIYDAQRTRGLRKATQEEIDLFKFVIKLNGMTLGGVDENN